MALARWVVGWFGVGSQVDIWKWQGVQGTWRSAQRLCVGAALYVFSLAPSAKFTWATLSYPARFISWQSSSGILSLLKGSQPLSAQLMNMHHRPPPAPQQLLVTTPCPTSQIALTCLLTHKLMQLLFLFLLLLSIESKQKAFSLYSPLYSKGGIFWKQNGEFWSL